MNTLCLKNNPEVFLSITITVLQNRRRDTDVQKRLLDSVGEGEGGVFRENSTETCILSRVKQNTSPGWMHVYWILNRNVTINHPCHFTLCLTIECRRLHIRNQINTVVKNMVASRIGFIRKGIFSRLK